MTTVDTVLFATAAQISRNSSYRDVRSKFQQSPIPLTLYDSDTFCHHTRMPSQVVCEPLGEVRLPAKGGGEKAVFASVCLPVYVSQRRSVLFCVANQN